MSKSGINYLDLENKITKKAYKLDDVKHRLEKVAFDVVRFKDSDSSADLWKIQNNEDGEQYIIALYNEDDIEKTADWEVEIVKTANALQVYYKGDPIVKVACNKLNIPESELNQVKEYLPYKLSENKKLVHSLLNELNESTKKVVLNKYPELI